MKTDLQLAICDGSNQKVFATATFPLKGVGGSEEQALTKALSSLNAKNPEFINFVEKERPNHRLLQQQLSHLPHQGQDCPESPQLRRSPLLGHRLPECCTGYNQAAQLANSIYTDKVNYDGAMLLAQAEGEWAADPTDAGAAAAYSYLAQIDPSAACYAQAKPSARRWVR